MSIEPLKHGSIKVRKSDLFNNRLLIGLDCGTRLIKVIFLHKDSETTFFDDKVEFVTLEHGLFESEHFKDAMTWTKKHAYFSEDTNHRVHITGRLSLTNRSIVESILGRETEYVEKSLSLICGHKLALEGVDLETLLAPPEEEPKFMKFESKFLENFIKSVTSKFTAATELKEDDTSHVFPCLIYVIGTMSRIYYFDEKGKGEVLGSPMIGGGALLGLGKCLLDTNHYQEIIDLASLGNRANVDTQVKDIMTSEIDSPYGKMPGEIPLFAFGKSMDYNKGLEDYAKEDVAMSLVAFISKFISTHSINACQIKRTDKIYLSGNIFNSNLFHKEIKAQLILFPFLRNLKVMNFGHFGALGAMVCNDNDRRIFYRE